MTSVRFERVFGYTCHLVRTVSLELSLFIYLCLKVCHTHSPMLNMGYREWKDSPVAADRETNWNLGALWMIGSISINCFLLPCFCSFCTELFFVWALWKYRTLSVVVVHFLNLPKSIWVVRLFIVIMWNFISVEIIAMSARQFWKSIYTTSTSMFINYFVNWNCFVPFENL